MAANRIVRAGGWTAVVTAALLAGCAPKQPAPPPPVPTRPVPVTAALDPESYMAFAASSAVFAARASNMAEGRGSTNKIKNYAAKVVMDQTAIGAQLNFAGRRLNLLPSSRPIPRHQAMLETLATSSSFDATYKRMMNEVLSEALAAHRTFEARGESPTLRPVASFAAPVCARNLEQLRKL